MACLMKRTPCCFAISPSSCGSMMTKRDLSYSKCRSISGSVPLPIEPKPIMTIGPEILAWIFGAGGVIGKISGAITKAARRRHETVAGNSDRATLGGHFDFDLHFSLVEAGDDQQGRGR